MKRLFVITFALAVVSACQSTGAAPSEGAGPASAKSGTQKAEAPAKGLAVATFAGGCFWCMEPPFDKVKGVKATISGYTGGMEQHPTYKEVAYGRTGHAESVRVVYDPNEVAYEKLLEVYWRNIDPTDPGGQFVDRGKQYRPAIFVHDDVQRKAAEASKAALMKSGRFKEAIAVPVEDAGDYWIAEKYHQDFYKKSPARYYSYRRGSGRDQFIAKVWGQE